MNKNSMKKIYNRNLVGKSLVPYVMMAPYLIVFLIFLVIPFFWSIILSFQKGSLLEPKVFIGFENFIRLFTNIKFLQALINTLKYLAIIIPSVFIISMIVALLLNSIKKFQNLFRIILLIPMLNSLVVAAIIWRFLLYPEYGLISRFVDFLHIPVINWFGNPKVVLITIAMVELWHGLGFYVITILAGIQSINKEIIEAANIDGANYFQTLFRIIIPSLKPILTFLLVMACIWNLQIFDSVYILTRGGPVGSSSTVVYYIYENTFSFGRVGFGATMSVILIIITAIITFINLKLTRFHEQEM